ncbi:class I fructose-bisphosphate aldolase [Deinococcus cellulosilyticus]|uniref:fructose-bisphosphate aldolase n=1 Tax=Deinococcus cellulosilyticus (strain DSM 18568 / NBRC 106333 / KACC 11606 / 5516J-15) TaxID=1223518 RepID=A0A511N2I6_DEIC1|nr:fructose-bisphosphate aldolase [Deinococcus cellulosilyticus]GEM46678.1 aldolase [Deinococcus cellulosilyticus NBRC 106333 = KACC 11606]
MHPTSLTAGQKSRLHQLTQFTHHRLLILPLDQGLEHGPQDFLPHPHSWDTHHLYPLAHLIPFSAVALHIGLAEKHQGQKSDVPWILKLNGKTPIPQGSPPFAALSAQVEDALRLNAQAVGDTLDVGSARQDDDMEQCERVRRQAHRHGLPVIVWAYPRGEHVDRQGGPNHPLMVQYAARVAQELGAATWKVNVPQADMEHLQEHLHTILLAAGPTKVVFAGGELTEENQVLQTARMVLQAGAAGLMFGRNVWQRPLEEALALSRQLLHLLRDV